MKKNDKDALQEFGKRLDERIKWKGIKKKHLALDLGVAPSQINAWTRGDVYPRIDTLVKISEILNVTLDWLIAGRGNAPWHSKKGRYEED